MCAQNNTLRWCKESPLNDRDNTFVTVDDDFSDTEYWYCALEEKPERTDLQYQQIKTSYVGDNLYQCLNRLDENPFNKSMDLVDKEEKWFNDVNKPCDEGMRRCLGYNTEQCVYADGGYLEQTWA